MIRTYPQKPTEPTTNSSKSDFRSGTALLPLYSSTVARRGRWAAGSGRHKCVHDLWGISTLHGCSLPGPEGPSRVSMKSGASPALFCVKGPLQPFFPVSLLTVEVTIIKSNELQLFPRTSGQQTALLLPPRILQPPVRDRPPGPARVDPARPGCCTCASSRGQELFS